SGGSLVTNIAVRPDTDELGLELYSPTQPKHGIFSERRQFVPLSLVRFPEGNTIANYLSDEVINAHFQGKSRDQISEKEIVSVILHASRNDVDTIRITPVQDEYEDGEDIGFDIS